MQYKQYEKSMLIYRGRKKNNLNSSKYQASINGDNRTQNLKSIHRTLVQTNKKQNYLKNQRSSVHLANQKQLEHRQSNLNNRSLYQLNQAHNSSSSKNKHSNQRYNQEASKQRKNNYSRSKHNFSVQSLIDTTKNNRSQIQNREVQLKDLQKPVNFYINIQKLKNLKITSRDKRLQESFVPTGSNSYLNKLSAQNLSLDKRSLILRSSQKTKNRSINSSYENIQSSLNSRLMIRKKNPNLKPKIRYKTHQNQLDQETDSSNNPARSHVSQYLVSKRSNFRKHELKDNSFIDGYLKGKQLGRGGFSKVWQGFHFSTKKFYAVKQIDTTNKYQTHLTEIWFGNYFFEPNGRVKGNFEKHPGVYRLLKMFEYSIIDPKAFIVYESCDGSLGNLLYDIYEEDFVDDEDIDQDQKMYMIKYKHLYGELRKNTNFLKHFVKSIAQALDLLVANRIVHSDIKTQNILLKKTEDDKKYEFKLIDYGSSFVFQSLKQYKLATPEYMCPQLLNYILFENKKSCHEYMLEYVKLYENISAIDVWGLGCIVIQLIHGLPLWLNNPTKILINGRYETKKGLFAASDRSFSMILQSQLGIVNNFDDFLKNENNSGIAIDEQIKDVIRGMLNPNPRHRIRPHEIVQRLSR